MVDVNASEDVAADDQSSVSVRNLSVQRSAVFTLMTADTTVAFDTGSGIELALLVNTPNVLEQRAELVPNRGLRLTGVQVQPLMIDLGHVRMDESTAYQAAMNILQSLVGGGYIESGKLIEDIASLTAERREDSADEQ